MDLNRLVSKDFRGCAMVCVDGKTIFEGAYGYADLPNQLPNQLGTRFATASAGKVFVAVGILQLVERGRLALNDAIGDVLKLDLHQIDPTVTVEELLTHTSGIPDYFDESVMEEYEELWTDFPNYKIRTNRDLLPLFIHKPMMYPRKNRFQYNNAGFVLLALILEELTGQAFDEYLAQHVFLPCGMERTGYYELDRLPARCAANYILDEARGGYRTNIFSVDAKGTGAGGAFTTLADIRLFWEGLLANRLLAPQTTAAMLQNHSGEASCYGYGIWLEKEGDALIPYFQGSDSGVSFVSRCDPAKKQLITLVSNFGDNVWALQKKIVECLAQ